MIIPVVLSGGAGTRLWPLSREDYPKQFLPIGGDVPLIQATIQRLEGLQDLGPPILVCNEAHRFLAAEQMRQLEISGGSILLEPVGRNTAPAVACAALHAKKHHPQALILVLPADHLIQDIAAFHRAVDLGRIRAEAGHLVTFGIVPGWPETGYGYIKRGAPLGDETTEATQSVYEVDRFVEKPDQKRAEAYLQEGGYDWNSGMFLFRADRYLEELKRLNPQMAEACHKAYDGAVLDLDFLRLAPEAFSASPKDSIDYAVMEKTKRGVVVPLDAGWSDVGAWSALWEIAKRDGDGNVTVGDVVTEDVKESYLSSSHRLVAAVGLSGHVVIETADAVLVAPKDRVGEVKGLVEALKKAGRTEPEHHRKVYRPWGSYETVDIASRFQVKRIVVKPGAILSLQMHHHRSEHWVVVRGTAQVTKGEEVFLLVEGQSTYIPVGKKHRLENAGKIPLELIEVQSGSYLGEDDIVRFDDRYGR
ncbi:MAG: mannose-1-phosphate guanylyltransferase/mannose-6-phosphate isomerase [Magnetococcales bacterium]|nr:mannose-1-phosphate guanylyltransferase/mannose-6-phosphate isomerase [Magnetococcales bacterium]